MRVILQCDIHWRQVANGTRRTLDRHNSNNPVWKQQPLIADICRSRLCIVCTYTFYTNLCTRYSTVFTWPFCTSLCSAFTWRHSLSYSTAFTCTFRISYCLVFMNLMCTLLYRIVLTEKHSGIFLGALTQVCSVNSAHCRGSTGHITSHPSSSYAQFHLAHSTIRRSSGYRRIVNIVLLLFL